MIIGGREITATRIAMISKAGIAHDNITDERTITEKKKEPVQKIKRTLGQKDLQEQFDFLNNDKKTSLALDGLKEVVQKIEHKMYER